MRRLIPLAVLAALGPSAWLAWNFRGLPHLGQYHDDMLYWVTGQSIARGSGYRILSLPEQPYQTKYPPLYPLLLAGVWKLFPSFPENLRPALLLAWLMLPLYLLASRWMLRALGVPGRTSWLLAAALALSPATVLLSVTLMSDLLFAALLLASLYWVQRAGARAALLAGTLAAAAYLTRLAALPLLLAAPWWLIRRGERRRVVLFAAPLLTAVAGWTCWARAHQAPGADIVTLYYTDYFRYQWENLAGPHWLSLVGQNAVLLLASITRLLTAQTGDSAAGEFAWRLFSFAAVAGVVRLAREGGLTAYHWFALGLAPLLILCAWPPDARSLVPLAPLLAAGLWREGKHVAGMLRGAGRGAMMAGGLLLSGAALPWAWGHGRVLFQELPGIFRQHRLLLAARREAYGWVAAHLPETARFVAYDDPLLYLYTGRRAASVRVPTRLYYQGDLEAFVKRHAEVEPIAGARGLEYLLTTAGDYHRGEVPEGARAHLLRAVEDRFGGQRLYASRWVAIYAIRSTSANTNAGSAAATADFWSSNK